MTRVELTAAVRRCNQLRMLILSVLAVAVVGVPIVNVVLRLPAPVVLGVFFGVPVVGFPLSYIVLRLYGVRCPHCAEYLGLEKRRFYDVTKTGRCRKCGGKVVDEMP